ncbi:unnamed protein product [Pneumocystis jirovecii]|uniref:Ribosomal protein S21 n=2 Tax=Pneumocystis jirovecii TaxID=42068 RepID=L0P817_PNEJI|nr:mitochondrial 37S ribosomal protein MRP21 [Pneumocystis jirovecii RU7]KTW29622.1 hypothetical protein T551_02238 [Pneumocystis jirovecii RU7]CCJ28513.1 unnamed protein product [Pneumocystis jirovecii]
MSKNIFNYKISNYFLHENFILWRPRKKILLIKKCFSKTIRHLTLIPFKCEEKDSKNIKISVTQKKTHEPSYNKSRLKTIKPNLLSENTNKHLSFPFEMINSLNNEEILGNKFQKLYIYRRAASREVRNQDVISSWKSLDILLKQNNVRQEERLGKFYEKPTKKRNRLRSERHRKRFRTNIRYLVSIVKEMKRRRM